MKQLQDMNREELLEVIKIKDEAIRELREEIEVYRTLADELQKKAGMKKASGENPESLGAGNRT